MAAPSIIQPLWASGTTQGGAPLYWLKADGTLAFANDTTPLPVTATFASGSTVILGANSSTTAATWTQATKTVAASGTPEVLAAATTLCDTVILEGKKTRTANNTGNVFIATSAGNDTQLLMIGPGERLVLTAPFGKKIDLNLIYVDVATNADGITYTALN